MPKKFRIETLTVAIASALALSTLNARATDLHVLNCSDNGTGSFRSAATAASNGDRVVFDVGTMNCNKITLTSGEVLIDSKDLTVQGPADQILTIDGNHNGRVIRDEFDANSSNANPKLTINNLTIQNGSVVTSGSGFAPGGCISSAGDLTLNSSVITGCSILNMAGDALGGGAFASSFHVYNSKITNNTAMATEPPGEFSTFALGGGLGNLFPSTSVIVGTVISGNSAAAVGNDSYSSGGGVYFFMAAGDSVSISASTISGNQANHGGGAFFGAQNYDAASVVIDHSTFSSNAAVFAGGLEISAAASKFVLQNSTISGNSASTVEGGASIGVASSTFTNDTIAFNTATSKSITTAYGTYNVSAGLYTTGTLTNTIVAHNTVANAEWDFQGTSITGSNNLIMLSLPDTTVPSDTSIADPMLTTLGDFGGPTQVHALMVGSPAIDAGCGISLSTDQRGPGYPRQFGPAVDIGAYEYGDPSSGDIIFRSGFDGGPCPK